MLVEESYVDRDYLEDFSAYYVRCFHPYERTCARLHFFTAAFTQDQFARLLQGEGDLSRDALSQGYRGFLVVRPLPMKVIGRTCLATYDSLEGRRVFPTVGPNSSNLFGVPLETRTLPFQEQDQVTSACATSALWSAFSGTARQFQHRLLSPVEITKAATARMPLRSRALPNTDGLTPDQMAHAIREVGLEPYIVESTDQTAFRSAVYAYVAGGIPVLLLFNVSAMVSGSRTTLGTHAVTVTGYGFPESSSPETASRRFRSKALELDKLYVHDDQVGPHARMRFHGSENDWYLSTSFGADRYEGVRALPVAILLPLYHKIRTSFRGPLNDVMQFNAALRTLALVQSAPGGPSVPSDILWDFRLTTVNQLKTSIMETTAKLGVTKRSLLTQDFPRFLWHASATTSAGPLIDILFDATDIDSGRYICRLDIHTTDVLLAIQSAIDSQKDWSVSRAFAQILNKMEESPRSLDKRQSV